MMEARQVRALLWPLIAWSAWAHQATVVACTTGKDAGLTSSRFVGVDSATVVADMRGEGAALASVRSISVGTASLCNVEQNR